MSKADPAAGKRDVLHRIDAGLVEWLDSEAGKRDRSRAWMIEEAIRQWKRRLERDRAARVRRALRASVRVGRRTG